MRKLTGVRLQSSIAVAVKFSVTSSELALVGIWPPNWLMPDATSMSPPGVAVIGVMIGRPNGVGVYEPPVKVNLVGSKCRKAWKPAAGNAPRLIIDNDTVMVSPDLMHSEPTLLLSTSCG